MSAWATGTFEYATHSRRGPMHQGELNKWGQAGWELCAVVDRNTVLLYTFRRSAAAAQAWAERSGEANR